MDLMLARFSSFVEPEPEHHVAVRDGDELPAPKRSPPSSCPG